jgi:YVTN family beta-propeller protein
MSARRWIVAGVLIVLLLAGGHAMAKRHTARWTAMSGQPPDCIACHVQPMMTPSAHDAGYKTPTCLAVSADGGRLLATGRDADALIVVDLASCLGAGSASAEPASGAIREVAVGREPEGVAFSPDGKVVYVANRREDSVSVVDAGSWHETGRFPVGDEPCGLATDARGTVLYVANAASDSVWRRESRSSAWPAAVTPTPSSWRPTDGRSGSPTASRTGYRPARSR